MSLRRNWRVSGSVGVGLDTLYNNWNRNKFRKLAALFFSFSPFLC